MRAKDVYIEIAQRYIASAKQLVSDENVTQEVIGFLTYHALESIGSAVIVHFKSSIPVNHETKLNMFLSLCKKHLAKSVNIHLVATTIAKMVNSDYRSRFLYPEYQNTKIHKAPKEQITTAEVRLLIQDVDRIINQIVNAI
jgi:hypothetical protein